MESQKILLWERELLHPRCPPLVSEAFKPKESLEGSPTPNVLPDYRLLKREYVSKLAVSCKGRGGALVCFSG